MRHDRFGDGRGVAEQDHAVLLRSNRDLRAGRQFDEVERTRASPSTTTSPDTT
jgi:hypothetical protein